MILKWRAVAWSAIGSAALVTLCWLAYSYAQFYFQMRHTIRNAPYVVVHVYESRRDFKVSDPEITRQLWDAITVLSRRQASYESVRSCETASNPCLAFVAFPIKLGEGDETFDWPIYVYGDGTVLWGVPPKQRRYFRMPQFRDKVMQIMMSLEKRPAGDNKVL